MINEISGSAEGLKAKHYLLAFGLVKTNRKLPLISWHYRLLSFSTWKYFLFKRNTTDKMFLVLFFTRTFKTSDIFYSVLNKNFES